MNTNHYKTALEAARLELAELEDQRAKIDKRISELQQGIVGLSALADEVGEKPQSMMDILAGVGADTGLTDATRMITSSFGFPMTPKQVRDALVHLGYDLGGYSNILASLHTIMKRLAKSGELINVVDEKGNEMGAYAWNPAVSPRRMPTNYVRNIAENFPSARKVDLTPLGKLVAARLKEKSPEWRKRLTEAGGVILANPPYLPNGQRLTARQKREVQEAREVIERELRESKKD